MNAKKASTNRFQADIGNCDVDDRPLLTQYRKKWQTWLSWYELSDDQPHSIENQLHQMFFNDLLYRSVVGGRQAASSDEPNALAPALNYMLQMGYVTFQVLAITKLLDRSRDVLSIAKLLDDISTHYQLITRENYVAGDGKPYDYEAVLLEAMKTGNVATHLFGIQAPGLSHALCAKERHEQFDRLSGVKQPDQRQRKDTIQPSVFEILKGWISNINLAKLRTLRNKYFAHAADDYASQSPTFQGLSFSQVDEAQRSIIRVERALLDNVLRYEVGRDVVPLPPLGLFIGLDQPFATAASLTEMQSQWDALKKERDTWALGAFDGVAPKGS